MEKSKTRVKARRQVVLPIDGRSDLLSAEIRGGKGTSLAVMHALGLPVPPAFTVSTTVMRAYCEIGVLPKRLEHQLERELRELEQKTGKLFGDRFNPLLLAVRSGAATSMPGMMDTILNLGMTPEVLTGFGERGEATFGSTLYKRFERGWNEATSEPIPEDPREQLVGAIRAVIGSWDNPRARTYREHHGISHALGTAVNVQAMVFGNRDERSGTGVVFSHNVNTGDRVLYGEFLPCAQGEEVVSGSRTPHSIEFLKEWNQSLYEELERAVRVLESHEHAMVEVEFTIESGKLWTLQHRKAKASLEARITSLVHAVWAKKLTHDVALASVTQKEVEQIAVGKTFDAETIAKKIAEGPVIRGIGASPGVACGRIAFTSEESVAMAKAGVEVILFRPDTNPDDLPGMLAAKAIVTQNGGATSHAAVVARALGKPAVVGATSHGYFSGDTMSVDGSLGVVLLGMLPICETPLKKEVSLFAKWYGGTAKFPKPRFDIGWTSKRTSVVEHLAHVYLLELMAHEAKGTVLARKVECLRCGWYTQTAEFFLCYLVHAVARELRHVHNREVATASPELRKAVSACGISSTRIVDDQETFVLSEIANPFPLLKTAVKAFHENIWSRSYWGKRWVAIAETALGFLEGTLGHTIFVDRVFDLQHNTGRVFNKHVMAFGGNDVVAELLDEKKRVSTATIFMERLCDIVRWTEFRFDPQVEALYQRGTQLKIWR